MSVSSSPLRDRAYTKIQEKSIPDATLVAGRRRQRQGSKSSRELQRERRRNKAVRADSCPCNGLRSSRIKLRCQYGGIVALLAFDILPVHMNRAKFAANCSGCCIVEL